MWWCRKGYSYSTVKMYSCLCWSSLGEHKQDGLNYWNQYLCHLTWLSSLHVTCNHMTWEGLCMCRDTTHTHVVCVIYDRISGWERFQRIIQQNDGVCVNASVFSGKFPPAAATCWLFFSHDTNTYTHRLLIHIDQLVDYLVDQSMIDCNVFMREMFN